MDLSTGTIVEDKLYSFGKTCFSNHPSQSLILDLNDLDIYVKKSKKLKRIVMREWEKNFQMTSKNI
jgi:shikimate kinase